MPVQIKQVKNLPSEILDNLGSWATSEFYRDRARTEYTLNRSCKIWIGRYADLPLFAAGLIRTSAFGTGYVFWFLGCRELQHSFHRVLRVMKRAAKRLCRVVKRITTYIATSFPSGRRFAEFFGFRQIGESVVENGILYTCYRLEA